MRHLIILHSNDIHGRVEGLARLASMVQGVKDDNPHAHVLYFDLGDSEEYTHRLSSLTKGSAMHRLLEAAGCQAVVVGNAMLARLGSAAVEENTAAVEYPHLLANVFMADGAQLPGTLPHALLSIDDQSLGLIGVSAFMQGYDRFHNLTEVNTLSSITDNTSILRNKGVSSIILLSHMGLEDDRRLAALVPEEIALILGGHSHSALPEGECAGQVLIAQAGHYAEHLGRVDLEWSDGRWRPISAQLLPIDETIPPSPAVYDMVETIEAELTAYLGEVIGQLPQSFDYATDRECLVGNLMADALCWWNKADIGLVVPGPVFHGDLPAGPITREQLWSLCHSPGNPGSVKLRGSELARLIHNGLNVELAADKHQALRGQSRGFIHISGASVRDGQIYIRDQPLDPVRIYQVGGSDFEFEAVWGYAEEAWELDPEYDMSAIMRDVLDAYLCAQPDLKIELGRIE